MAKNPDRKIVHIKDVFSPPGAPSKEKERDSVIKIFPNANGPADPPSSSPSPGAIDEDGYVSPRHVSGSRQSRDSRVEQPRFVKASNQSDVFFGAPPPSAGLSRPYDTRSGHGTAASRTRKKRPAPLPPSGFISTGGEFEDSGIGAGMPSPYQPRPPTPPHITGPGPNPFATRPLPAIPGQEGYQSGGNSPRRSSIQPTSNASSSGVETDDSHSTNAGSCAGHADMTSEDRLAQYKVNKFLLETCPSPDTSPLAPTGQGRHQDGDDQVDSDYEEEELVVDFGEETGNYHENKYTQVYKEFYGMDFSGYIQEGDEDGKQQKGKKKYRKKKAVKAPQSPTFSSSMSSADSTMRSTLQRKVGNILSNNSIGKNSSLSQGSIHSFSYSDSKMGTSLDMSGAPNESVESAKEDPRGGAKSADNLLRSKHWWNRETLSAKRMEGNAEVLLGNRRCSSIVDLNVDLSNDQDESEDRDSGLAYTTDSEVYNDFESYRKNKMYSPGSSQGKRSKKSSLWRKLRGTLQRKSKVQLENDNTTTNPLADVADYGDIKL